MQRPWQQKLALICLRVGLPHKARPRKGFRGSARAGSRPGGQCTQASFLCQAPLTPHEKWCHPCGHSVVPPGGHGDSGTGRAKTECVRMREARMPRSSPRECFSFCSKQGHGHLGPCPAGGPEGSRSTAAGPTASLLHFLGNTWQPRHWLSRFESPRHVDATRPLPRPMSLWELPPSLFPIKGRQSRWRRRGREEEAEISPDTNNSHVGALIRTQPPA